MFRGHLVYFQKPSLGGSPNTQNWETMTLRMLTTVGLFYFIIVWGPTWIEIHWNTSWLMARSHMASHYTWESMTTLHDFGGVLEWPLDGLQTLSFGPSQSHGHSSWLVCKVLPNPWEIAHTKRRRLCYQRTKLRRIKHKIVSSSNLD